MTRRAAPPEAILFGSIGTLAETSDLQRRAYNLAFDEAGLDWHWDPETYARLLRRCGGRARILRWAEARRQSVDADALHRRKSLFFQDMLAAIDLPLRPGVAEVFTRAMETNTRLAFVTTTSASNVEGILRAVYPPIGYADFATVVTGEQVARGKPAPDCYRLALSRLGLRPDRAIAVEDSPESAAAASAAGVPVVAFPGLYHADASFPNAMRVVSSLSPAVLSIETPDWSRAYRDLSPRL